MVLGHHSYCKLANMGSDVDLLLLKPYETRAALPFNNCSSSLP